jgi:plastocyanin
MCSDMVKNGTETDIDCGGSCDPCFDGDMCALPSDCVSGVCMAGICQVPLCTDGVKNGIETDIDCGGACDTCADGASCEVAADCSSAVCMAGICQADMCFDGVKNGTESDVDCGGSCPGCALGKTCGAASDCLGQICSGGVCSQINGCDATNTTDLTGLATTTVTFSGTTYNPPCIRVKVGTTVTFSGSFSAHPLVGGEFKNGMEIPAASGPFVPATNVGFAKTFQMSAAGTYPYYCDFHSSAGMFGTVFVVP